MKGKSRPKENAMRPLHDINGRQRSAVLLLVVAVTFYISARAVADPDLWGHVRFGQDILAGRGLHAADPYSYLAAGQPWINHEWACEAVFAAVFNAASARPAGLENRDRPRRRPLAASPSPRRGRPHIGCRRRHPPGRVYHGGGQSHSPPPTVLLFLLPLAVACDPCRRQRPRPRLVAIPPIIAVWANFHGAFVAGLGLLAVWSAARIAAIGYEAAKGQAGRRPNLQPTKLPPSPSRFSWIKPCLAIALPVLAALLAATLNPYGPRLLAFLWQTATVPRPDIMEWQPVDVTKTEGVAYLCSGGVDLGDGDLAPAGLAGPAGRIWPAPPFCRSRRCGTCPWRPWRLPCWPVLISLPHGSDGLAHPRRSKPSPAGTQVGWAASLLPASAAIVLSGATLHCSTRIAIDPQHAAFPARAVAMIRSSGVRGNMAVYFDWGEYVLWHLGPQIKVSYDGRRETVYSEAVRQLNSNWAWGVGEWDALLDRRPTDLALLDKRLPGCNLMRLKPGWKLVYEDSLAAVFVRDKAELVAAFAAATPGDIARRRRRNVLSVSLG